MAEWMLLRLWLLGWLNWFERKLMIWAWLIRRTAASVRFLYPLSFQKLYRSLTRVLVHLSIGNGFHPTLSRIKGRVAILANSVRAYRVLISFWAVFDFKVTSQLAAFSFIQSCEHNHLRGILTLGHWNSAWLLSASICILGRCLLVRPSPKRLKSWSLTRAELTRSRLYEALGSLTLI